MMDLLTQSLRLMRRELRHGLRGFGVFATCLFLGVFAVAAIGNFSAAARSGLLDDAGALLGGDLELRLAHRPADDEQLEFLQQNAVVSSTLQLRTMALAVGSEQRRLVELKAVDDLYPLYGRLLLDPPQRLEQAFAERDDLPGALVESSFLDRLNLAVGDLIQLGSTQFQIRGRLINEPDRSFGAFTLGPRIMIDQARLMPTGLVQPGSLVDYNYRLKLADRELVDEFRRELEARFPDAGWRIRTWRQATPRISDFLDRMETNLTLLGLCALLLGGLGVTGAVRGYLGGKVSHIATMKSLGASRKLIFTTYLAQILFLGAIATLAGLICGAAIPWLLSSLLGSNLPFPLTVAIFPRVWVIVAIFGLLTALLFSLKELGTACRIPPALLFRGYVETRKKTSGTGVRVAMTITAALLIAVALFSSADQRLALWFISGAAGCFVLFHLLAALVIKLTRMVPRPSQPLLRLALTSLKSPGSPASNIVFSLGIGLTVLVLIVQIQGNLNSLVTTTLPEKAPTFFFFDLQPQQIEPFNAMLADYSQDVTFDASPTLRGRITAIAGVPITERTIDPSVRWAIRGDRFFSYAAAMPAGTRITAGDWWSDDYQGPPLLSITSDLAAGFGVGIGDTISVSVLGRTITAEIANLRSVDWSTLELNFALIFAPGTLEQAPHSFLAAAHLPAEQEEELYRRITAAFPNVSAVSVREILANVARNLEHIGWAFKGMAAITLLTGFLVLIGAISADQHRRIRDAVIYKVCGSTRQDILRVFAAEFLLLGLITGGVSLFIGTLAAFAILEGPLNSDFQLQGVAVLFTLLTGIALTMILGLLGTWKALGQKASTYLRR
ncbi:MAG: FtsX-like permease family protein [Desulfuromonadales bacterium]|nr:FtsX-like permease family protein [Desulfuromonadales bacterium]